MTITNDPLSRETNRIKFHCVSVVIFYVCSKSGRKGNTREESVIVTWSHNVKMSSWTSYKHRVKWCSSYRTPLPTLVSPVTLLTERLYCSSQFLFEINGERWSFQM